MATHDEVPAVLAGRYEGGNRKSRSRLLDGSVALTGHRRKHAARVLRGGKASAANGTAAGTTALRTMRPARR